MRCGLPHEASEERAHEHVYAVVEVRRNDHEVTVRGSVRNVARSARQCSLDTLHHTQSQLCFMTYPNQITAHNFALQTSLYSSVTDVTLNRPSRICLYI